jgi:hypothetical protein
VSIVILLAARAPVAALLAFATEAEAMDRGSYVKTPNDHLLTHAIRYCRDIGGHLVFRDLNGCLVRYQECSCQPSRLVFEILVPIPTSAMIDRYLRRMLKQGV